MHSCYEMDREDIRELQGFYVAAAERARDAGFDLILIYGAETVPITQQFLMPYFNRRTDEYGGSFENRARFTREVLELIRDALGDDCALGVRFSIDTLSEDGLGIAVLEDGVRFIEHVDHLVDLWDVQVGPPSLLDTTDSVSASRVRPENWQKPWVDADPLAHEQADRRCRPVHEPRHDGRRDPLGTARHHRRGATVDRRSVPAEQDRAGAARRDPRVHRLQRLHRPLQAGRRPPRVHAEPDRGRGVPPGLASGEVHACAQQRQRRARGGRGTCRDGVRDRARQARHAPGSPGGGRRRAGRRNALDRAAPRARRVGARGRLPPDPDPEAQEPGVHPAYATRRHRGRRVRRRDRRHGDRLAVGGRRPQRLDARRDPGGGREPAALPDARAGHGRRDFDRRASTCSSTTARATSWGRHWPRSSPATDSA